MEGPWGQSQPSMSAQPVTTSLPPPPVFGFQPRDDTINLEDIFSDWFAEEFPAMNAPAPPQPTIQQQQQQQQPQQPLMYNQQPVASYGQPMQQQYVMQPQYSQAQDPNLQQAHMPQANHQQQDPYPPRMPGPMVLPQSQMQHMQHPAVHQQPRMMVQPPMMSSAPQPPAPLPLTKPPIALTPATTTTTTAPAMGGMGGMAKAMMPSKMSAMIDADDDDLDDYDDDDEDDEEGGGKKKRPRSQTRRMTEEQKVERRERNREHAKRSRVRKKFLLDSLQKSVNALQEENDKLKTAIRGHLKDQADDVLKECKVEADDSLITSDPNSATKILDDPDYTLVKALQTAQQNFVITDPSLPDNPIVYASQGFLSLTGYSMDQILGRNCRFLQGPDTDPDAVDKIRRAIEEGVDGSVCLLNYREDGTTFWNQFFIAALRGADGNIVNYVGVQCKVSEEYAKEVLRAEKEKEANDEAARRAGTVKKESS